MRRAVARTTEITQREARAAFALWRTNVPDGLLMATTVQDLMNRYRLPAKELECALLAEQDKRRRRANG